MTKIRISHTVAYDAIVWASKHFGDGNYIVYHTFPADMYEFGFERTEQASMFALKWM